MEVFRKLYYKLTILSCIIVTFIFMLNAEKGGIGYACLYIFAGLLCFGCWSIGKEQIDPNKVIRNILLLLLWSLLGFGMMAIGVTSIIGNAGDNGLLTGFLTIMFFALIIVYIISIIKNKDIYAIISVALFVIGFVIAMASNGIFILGLLSLILFVVSIGLFIFSIIKGIIHG